MHIKFCNLSLMQLIGGILRHPRYSHCFQNTELAVFQSAMGTIVSNNDPSNPSYQFIVSRSPTGDTLKECGKTSRVPCLEVSHRLVFYLTLG
jgi:hypothetical protein